MRVERELGPGLRGRKGFLEEGWRRRSRRGGGVNSLLTPPVGTVPGDVWSTWQGRQDGRWK